MPNTPNKQAVRDYMQSRTVSKEPPPSTEEIRRKLGWYLREECEVDESYVALAGD